MSDLILLKTVNYFGRTIRRGSTFKREESNKDWYTLYENRDGIIMHCPTVRIHFTSVTDSYFVEQYGKSTGIILPVGHPCSLCGSKSDCEFFGSDPCPRR